ncbi:MAG: hypothetical protein OEO20_15560 [Gemmatimonadota bacterium]|nr:hypothetical protein [Gemmatimonadota bacterium]MDH3479713.1 hypothetical protein [Gemmatimonadota bacterium]MDH3571920.1 hypothetical protein [Gemmatimonadota bacterium]
MRRLLAVLTLAVLVVACYDQPTALDETVAPQARVSPADRKGWVVLSDFRSENGEIVRSLPCLGDIQVFGTQTIYAKRTTTGWGGLNMMIDNVFEPGHYVQEVATGFKWSPTFAAQPGHFQLKRDGSTYRAATELLENYVREDGALNLKVRTRFSFEIDGNWDGTGDPPILFDTYELKIQACVVN